MRRYELAAAPDLAVLGGTALESREFTDSYYDTGDRRLASSGLTLQRRLERGVSTWLLNATGNKLAPAWYLLAVSMVSLLGLLWMRDFTGKDIDAADAHQTA